MIDLIEVTEVMSKRDTWFRRREGHRMWEARLWQLKSSWYRIGDDLQQVFYLARANE